MVKRVSVHQNNYPTLFPKKQYSGEQLSHLAIKEGSRLVFTMYVFSIDPGAQVDLQVSTSFSEQMPFVLSMNLSSDSVGHFEGIVTDFHGFIDVKLEVTNGSAVVIVGMSVFDNAVSTRIPNAELKVEVQNDKDFPVPVTITESNTFIDYSEDTGVPASDSVDHVYDFQDTIDVKSIAVCASNYAMFTLFVKLTNSSSLDDVETLLLGPDQRNGEFNYRSNPMRFEPGGQIKIVKSNLDTGLSQTLFSTIKGSIR